MTRHDTNPRYRYWLFAALCCGAVVRAVYLWQSSQSPFFDHPISDAAHFDQWAKQIAGGNFIGSGPFFRAPLYAYFLALVYSVFGHSYVWVRVVQHLIGLAGIGLIATLARRVWDDRAGIACSWLGALYPTFIYFEGELLSDALLVFWTPLLLMVTIRAVRLHRPHLYLASGLVAGLYAATRPTVLATLPVLLLWIVYRIDRKQRLREGIVRIGLCILGVTLIVGPIAIRNRLVGNDSVLIASQGGINFFIGNNVGADGCSASVPPWGTSWTLQDVTRQAEQDAGRPLKPSEVSDYWLDRGLEFWTDQPLRALGLQLRKFALIWQNDEFANNQDLYWYTSRWGHVLRWIPISFGVIVAFGILGWSTTTHRNTDRLWLLVWSLAYAITISVFFVVARFRLPVVGVWIVASSAGVVWLVDQYRRRSWGRLIIGIIGVLTIAMLTTLDKNDHTASRARSHLVLGNILLLDGRPVEARATIDSAIAIHPSYRGAWLSRGAAFYREGKLDSAASSFTNEAKLHPSNVRALINLSQVQLDQGDTASALLSLTTTLSFAPYDGQAISQMASVLRSLNQSDSALQVIEHHMRHGHPAVGAELIYGVLLLDGGQLSAAESALQSYLNGQSDLQTIEASPDPTLWLSPPDSKRDLALAHYNLGVLNGYRQDWTAAISQLENATLFDSSLGAAWSNLAMARLQTQDANGAVSAAQRAVATDSSNPVYLYALAAGQLGVGNTQGAEATLRRILEIDSAFAPARQLLELSEGR